MKKIIVLFLLLSLLLTACGLQPNCTTTETPGMTGTSCNQHKDSNDDGRCDNCLHSLLVPVKFYAINDLHGKLADGDSHIGVDELTAYWRNEQKYNNVVLLSAGDMWQGSSESNMTQGQILTDWMNDLGFAAMTLGNHEFDWGEAAIEANAATAQFPILAINIYDRDTNERVEYCDASTVVEFGNVQIGIIGAMGDCYNSIAADKTQGVYFKVGDELTQLVKEESQRLRTECGVDFIVYVLHDGYGSTTDAENLSGNQISSYYDIDLSNGYVDLVFEGHSHQKYCFVDRYGVYHMQNRGDNKGGVSYAQVSINYITGSYQVGEAKSIATDQYKNWDDDPIVEDLLEKYKEQIAPAEKIVGYNSQYRSSQELGQIVAQLYYELGVATWGDAYTITMGGGSLSTRSPYNLSAGEVKYADLQSLFPFDNEIRLCAIEGSELKQWFIGKGDYYAIGADGPLKKEDIQNDTIYYIVLDTWTSDYDRIDLTVLAEYTPGIYARDLLADFIAAGGLE